MNKFLFVLFITTIKLFLVNSNLSACTAFCVKDSSQVYLAKNLDWSINDGLIFVNQPGRYKTVFTDQHRKISWTAKYGSVTFNQFGKEFPLGGMNEAGLVIEELNLYGKGPQHDSLFMINEFQWVQYYLDNCRSVDEVLNTAPFLVVKPVLMNLHYIITDPAGKIAIIEFCEDKIDIYSGDQILYPVLSNNRYARSLKYIRNFKGFGGTMAIRSKNTSAERFVKASACISGTRILGEKNDISKVFSVLDSVRQNDTQWQIVYDVIRRQIHFIVSASDKPRNIDLKKIAFGYSSVEKCYNIMSSHSGQINDRFTAFTPRENISLLKTVYEKYKKYQLGEKRLEFFLNWAEYGNAVHKTRN